MQPYGNTKIKGYGEMTGHPSCKCCNGQYAKVGRAANKKNNLRGLKKKARQEGKRESNEII